MSDIIKTIVDKQAYDELDQLAKKIGQVNNEFIDLYKASQKMSGKPIKLEIASDFEKRLKTSTTLTKKLNATQKENERITKARATAEAKFYSTQSGTNKQLQQTRVETNKLNKEVREQAMLNSDMTGEYKKLSIQMGRLRSEYKDLAIQQATGVKLTDKQISRMKNLEKEVNELDQAFKDVDASVGQHGRNVGNYQSGLTNLHPALDSVNHGLEGMGTSLDDLAQSKNPFKILATSVMAFGRATMAFLLSPVGMAITAIGALFLLIKRNKDTVLQFNSDLVDVGKTTGLSGDQLEYLGNKVVGLSRQLKTVGIPELMGYAKVAGQLGVQGTQNILKFTEGLAKLETATDISGEEGASQIARLLTLTDGGVENVAQFGDEIVVLGNNFAATEKEILGNATAIAQNTAQYEFGRRNILAYATATKALGIEQEITGSTIGRTLGVMEESLRTGKNVDVLVKTTGKSVEELQAQFKEDSAGTFTEFVEGLNRIDAAGGSVNEQLDKIGITAIRDKRVIGSLATGGFEVLQDAMDKVRDSSGALDKEFKEASGKLNEQLGRVGKAWDNLVLSVENGQGVFGKFFAWIAGEGADYIEKWNLAVDLMGASWGGLTAMIGEVKNQLIEFVQTVAKLGDIEIDFLNPGKMAASAKEVLSELKDQLGGDAAKEIGSAFVDGFNGTMDKIGAEAAIKKALREAADASDNETIEGPKYNEGSAEAIQAAISALENQRDKFATTAEEVREYNFAIDELQKKLEALEGTVRETEISIQPVQKNIPGEGINIETPQDTAALEAHLYEKKEKEKTQILQEEEQKRRELIAGSFQKFAEFYGVDFEAFENLITKKTELTKEDWVNAAGSAANTILSLTQRKYDQELAYARENMEAVLNNERATEEQKLIAKQKFEKKEKQINRKKAEDEKRASLFSIAINTAVAIAKALPNVPLSILAGALGAAQAAFVASQPIPKFKDGHLLGNYEGPALINDAPGGNYREVLEHSDGSLSLPKERNVVVGMKKGDKVHKNYDSFLAEKGYDQVIKASILTSIANQHENLTSAQAQAKFDQTLQAEKIEQSIEKGFRNVKMNIKNEINNDNSELLRELRKFKRFDI